MTEEPSLGDVLEDVTASESTDEVKVTVSVVVNGPRVV